MNKLIGILLFVLIIPSFSANEHFLGIRTGSFYFISNTSTSIPTDMKLGDESKVYLTNLYLTYRYEVSELISFSTRSGYLWTTKDVYNGFESGVYFQLMTKEIYLLVGGYLHWNESYEITEQNRVNNALIKYLSMGVGFRIDDNMSVELQYDLPFESEYKTGVTGRSQFSPKTSHEVVGIFRLTYGIEFGF